MDHVLERSKSSKQSELSSSFLKNVKAKLGKVMSKLILHEAVPVKITESPFLQLVLQVPAKVGKLVNCPSTYEVIGVYLEDKYKKIQIWEERGVTITCDGWKGTANQYIVSFLIYSTRGTIFKKSIDASSVTSRTVEYYFGLMDKMVNEIDEEFVVQVVTDNKAAIKSIGHMLMQKRRHLYWSVCSAYCLDLILEEIGYLMKLIKKMSMKKLKAKLFHLVLGIIKTVKAQSNEDSVQLSTSSDGDGSSSRSLATNENEISELSSQSSHSYQPNAFYPPYFGHNSSYESFGYHLPHHMFPTNDASHGSILPHFAYNVMLFSHGMGGDRNQGNDENR
ncbi:hypothetical protein PVK06_001613 [Gossypium arboreum]|uniref:DUF659 domain-containing protein n=1 Tax=Gossypium arboreum TaxID=29729 RepID=A0ABR0R1H3_GOSAR|nr:hypothetical protein PVK06_001613 [Gossypium arboreum]